jgi:hypothetical protein
MNSFPIQTPDDKWLDEFSAERSEHIVKNALERILAHSSAGVDGQAEAQAARSLNGAENLRLRAARVATEASQVWRRFGVFLPSRTKTKILSPLLAEHTSDFFASLVEAGTRGKQNWLILSFTIAAVAKVLSCTCVAFRRRLRDEFDMVASRKNRLILPFAIETVAATLTSTYVWVAGKLSRE